MPKLSKTPGIRKRGNKFQVEIRVTGQPALRKTFATLKDAKTWQRAELVKLDQGGDITRETLAWLIADYRKKRGVDTYVGNVLDWWNDRLGRKRLSELKKKDFTLARSALQEEPKANGDILAPATVNRRVAAISAVLSYGIEELHLLDNNPAHIKALSEDNARDPIKAGWQHQRGPLLQACRDFTTGVDARPEPALLLLVQLGLVTGCRAGELLALRWDDIDIDAGLIYITKNTRRNTTKNAESRAVPLYGEALELLKTWRAQYRLKFGGYVIGNTRTGTTPYNYRAHWSAVKKSAGIDDLRFHDLRHIAASELAMAGESLGTVGAVLGHKSAQMTQRYSHYATSAISDLGKRMADKQA